MLLYVCEFVVLFGVDRLLLPLCVTRERVDWSARLNLELDANRDSAEHNSMDNSIGSNSNSSSSGGDWSLSGSHLALLDAADHQLHHQHQHDDVVKTEEQDASCMADGFASEIPSGECRRVWVVCGVCFDHVY